MDRVEKRCDVCQRTFTTRTKSPERERFCGKQCNAKFWNAEMRKKRVLRVVLGRSCEHCQKTYLPSKYHPLSATCSQSCRAAIKHKQRSVRRADERDQQERPCPECKQAFIPNKFNWKIQKYCSTRCARRVASRKYGRRNPGQCTGRARRSRLNGNWLKALARDANQCRFCHAGSRLVVHHLDCSGALASPNNTLDNLLTLCWLCHKQWHSVRVIMKNGEVYVSGELFDRLKMEAVKVWRLRKDV